MSWMQPYNIPSIIPSQSPMAFKRIAIGTWRQAKLSIFMSLKSSVESGRSIRRSLYLSRPASDYDS